MLTLFFVNELSTSGTQEIDEEDAHHAVKVLRLNIGKEIKISDGKGNWVSGPIAQISKKALQISIAERGKESTNKPELILVQAITKSDRSREMLELITAAGVDQVIPWQAERSISKWQDDSERKWLATIKESCKQSRRVRVPAIRKIMNTTSLAKEINTKNLGLVFHESSEIKFAETQISSNLDAIYLIIGPEGGITDNELAIFQSSGSMIVRLGPTVLRSAHAGFAALSAVQTKLGRW